MVRYVHQEDQIQYETPCDLAGTVESCLAVVARTASRGVIYVVNRRFRRFYRTLADKVTRSLQWRVCDPVTAIAFLLCYFLVFVLLV
jgi:hypothetical protein